MDACFVLESDAALKNLYCENKLIPVVFITLEDFPEWLLYQTESVKNWLNIQNFNAKPLSFCQIPAPDGSLKAVIMGYVNEKNPDFSYLGHLVLNLPAGMYKLENFHPSAALAWGMGAYRYTKYKINSANSAKLFLPEKYVLMITALLNAVYLVRNLINTPAEDMGPDELAGSARHLAQEFGAFFHEIKGKDLLRHNFPAIYAVGRAAAKEPRLLDLQWGKKTDPKVTLVGKGVCFDSGGLDLKTPGGMALMKKDMGGAAHVLGLAYLIMFFQLPIRLRVLIPALENAVSGNAYRPGDVIRSRKGLSIEIGNTDAEGRVVLCDALTEAAGENPVLLIDFATLTGAARIALGTELPALFSNDDELAQALIHLGEQIHDPVWRMPLYQPYRKLLDSSIADINNISNSGYAGAVTAALFLKEFVPDSISWAHFDVMAFNIASFPAHPEGGEAMGMRTVFAYLQQRFSARSSVG